MFWEKQKVEACMYFHSLMFFNDISPKLTKGWKKCKAKLEKEQTHRGWDENGKGIPPHTPKPNKARIWTHILKQEVICQWDNYCVTIDRTCSHIDIANIKAPWSTLICLFFHEISCKISQWRKNKNQSRWDPYKPISIETEKICSIRYPWYMQRYWDCIQSFKWKQKKNKWKGRKMFA